MIIRPQTSNCCSTYIFTCACIWATFISATFIASFILEFFSAVILCSELTSSSWASSSFLFLLSSASIRSFLPFSGQEMAFKLQHKWKMKFYLLVAPSNCWKWCQLESSPFLCSLFEQVYVSRQFARNYWACALRICPFTTCVFSHQVGLTAVLFFSKNKSARHHGKELERHRDEISLFKPYFCPVYVQKRRTPGGSTDPQDQDHPHQPQCQEFGKG